MSTPASTGVAVGLRARRVFEVIGLDTASAVGSGSVPALGTPRLLAWMEAATVAALEPALAPNEVSVGTHVELDHVHPSAVGVRVSVEAVIAGIDGRRVECAVEASDGEGTVIGRGRITRMVLDRELFLERLGPGAPG